MTDPKSRFGHGVDRPSNPFDADDLESLRCESPRRAQLPCEELQATGQLARALGWTLAACFLGGAMWVIVAGWSRQTRTSESDIRAELSAARPSPFAGDERAILDHAREVLPHHPEEALALVQLHQRSFPESPLASEREELRARALTALGRAPAD